MSIQSIRGMRDVLPEEGRRWRRAEDRIRRVLLAHGYEEIHLPLLEATELFSRGVGEATDIVEKEMYTLADRDGDSITLRPEGTAGCVRALLEHGLLFNQTQRVFYAGPMFRYERPQRGRYRQFYQLGAEAFGFPGPDIDAELILMGYEFWRALGVAPRVRLEINTLGSAASRAAYREALVAYLTPLANRLDDDSRRRLERNPLRILDSKNADTQALLADAPRLPDFVDDEGQAHFDALQALLENMQVPYVVNPGLVRGLDYYTHTVFEWISDDIGAQSTVCAGGRYDGLVERLGGRSTPGAGFALGLERVLLLVDAAAASTGGSPGSTVDAAADAYVCVMEPGHQGWAFRLAQKLRDALPAFRIRTHVGGGKLKNQMKRADQSGARFAVVIGEDEVREGRATLKFLREDRPQEQLAIDALIERLRVE
ncbi:MAG: histidine--tRNA ligase [Gammaproteobacteria bacterium]|nr:histidine--tRNA ligase [Gammaproteobacteria bacterium]